MVRTISLALALAALPAAAQHAHPGHHQPPSPYAGQEDRAIKALDPADVKALLDGAGHGFAKAAELNRYPGPLHALELAPALGLDGGQSAALAESRARMSAEAKRLGAAVVEAEGRLDRLFAGGAAEPAAVARLTAEIGALTGALRAVHLNAHIETRAILTPAQVERYGALRGYGQAGHRHP
ncbi:MAG TPA: hypothetical protein VEH84_10275 [Alphaproteobacteria bacterium]|nr:hypothetical protein [Alphaproteobacteria bacterium]